MSKNELNESLDIMCERCVHHEMCGGTGCQPKKDLAMMIEAYGEEDET